MLLGPSGSGKSTLLQALTGILPQTLPAQVDGALAISGQAVASRSPAAWSDRVAQFFQDADRTLTGLRVEDEIAFALENRALPEAEIVARVARVMAQVGLPATWRSRRTSTLSGGEKQLVALAATLIADAPLFVADEPTAALAPSVAQRVYDLVLRRANNETVLIVDHRLDDMIDAIDQVTVLGDAGSVIAEGPPANLFREEGDRLDAAGIWTPLASQLDRALIRVDLAAQEPVLTLDALMAHLESLHGTAAKQARDALRPIVRPGQTSSRETAGAPLVTLNKADCAPLFGPSVLRDVSMTLHAGEVVGLLGTNGAGKSTLGASLAGLLRLKAGTRHGAAGAIAFQNPENQFLEASVRDEIAAALAHNSKASDIDAHLQLWSLTDLARQHPFELSQGQKRRLALACLTATDRWPFLVLDEPTSGLDARGVVAIEAAIASITEAGRAIVVITHDLAFAHRVCGRFMVLADGKVLAEASADAILRDKALLDRADLAPPPLLPVIDWMAQVT